MKGVASLAHFDRLHADSADPWNVRTRWYERRKLALLLAALPRERYGRGFEPGCSVGGNTRALALRCDTLWASDASPAAIERAAQALQDVDNVQLEKWGFPQRWPDQACDLVVVAELAYYLPPEDFRRFLREVPDRLAAQGHLLMCHWRQQVDDAPTNGDAVHQAARQELQLLHVGGWQDADIRIDVWQNGGGISLEGAA